MKKSFLTYLIVVLLISFSTYSQIETGKQNIENALLNPEKITSLDLSNSKEDISKIDFSKFVNLEYLTLKNDHLKKIPESISKLKSLKILDLSGNDFKKLPDSFSDLSNLEEIYLNDEKNLNLPKTLKVLMKLPKLKTLHLENDNIESLPSEILNFNNLEYLYLNNNNLKTIPKIETLDHLKYLDLKDNKIKPELQDMRNLNFGFKIIF
ncbi:leucine-rich repeat domain-containing protein [Flavobacterium sp.]|uniref:leucine-rich repeat domain-containing protein n=1 Tax=Flavobacterium sp. TaxID=239 RepID=UPI002487818B|nr:leucine-rich repeat domain-containing protein [Flavobacterium sp.]MDI1316425.1 leucine-rich repeat domain-containing protein [Flavobacterium sp.]